MFHKQNKTLSSCDYIISNDFDIVALTETWFGTSVDKVCISELVPPGCKIKHVPLPAGIRGGGVGIIYKSLALIFVSSHLVEILSLLLLNT